MKRITSVIICVLFFGALLIPGALLPLTGDEPIGNRPLAQMPDLIEEGAVNLSFPLEMEDYFQDRFYGRAPMIDAYSAITGNVFSISSSDSVVWGDDGWLFFAETVGDFEGSSKFSDEQAEKAIKTVEIINETVEERGGEFLLAIAPNKNTLYGEYMPNNYSQTSDITNYDIMLTGDYETVDLKTAFLAQEDELYYKTDSHWNGEGARFAANEIMSKIEEITGKGVVFDWHGVSAEPTTIEGDLAVMLYPQNTPQEEDVTYPDTQVEYSGRVRSPEEMNISTTSEGTALNVYLMRDSFTNSLINYFSNAYQTMNYTRIMPLPLETSAAIEADICVLEIVERRLPELLLSAPGIYAREVQLFDVSTAIDEGSVYIDEERIYGIVPELGANVSVMFVGEEKIAYEAFPIVESAMISDAGDNFDGMDGFSAQIKNIPAGDYEVFVTDGERSYSLQAQQ